MVFHVCGWGIWCLGHGSLKQKWSNLKEGDEFIVELKKPTKLATSRTNSGEGQWRKSLCYDMAGRLPSTDTSMPTNSILFWKKWLFLKLRVRRYALQMQSWHLMYWSALAKVFAQLKCHWQWCLCSYCHQLMSSVILLLSSICCWDCESSQWMWLVHAKQWQTI